MIDNQRAPATDDREFVEFYETWRPPVRKGLALALGDVGLADEAVDEAMTRALTHWHKISSYERPEAWLFRVGLNWARGVFRKRRYELLSDLEPISGTSYDPVPDPELIAAIGRLPLKLRAPVVARYYFDLSVDQIADGLDIPAGTVKSRLSRALGRLGRELGESS